MNPEAGPMTRLRKTLCVNDEAKLKELLLKTNACEDLSNLFELALKSSDPHNDRYKYRPLTKAFCDGF